MRSSSPPPAPRDAHLAALRARGASEASLPGLVAYLDRLAAWSPRINLTGARTAAERVDTLVAPVLPLAELLGSGRVIDVGSGNGSPGLVVALLRPDLEVVLVEPRAKRCAFLREAARSAGRPEVAVFRGRHDEYPGPPAAAVLLRALALPLEALRPLVAADGRIFLLGGRAEGAEGFAEEPGRPGLRIFGRRST